MVFIAQTISRCKLCSSVYTSGKSICPKDSEPVEPVFSPFLSPAYLTNSTPEVIFRDFLALLANYGVSQEGCRKVLEAFEKDISSQVFAKMLLGISLYDVGDQKRVTLEESLAKILKSCSADEIRDLKSRPVALALKLMFGTPDSEQRPLHDFCAGSVEEKGRKK